jgi:hypothetical protein
MSAGSGTLARRSLLLLLVAAAIWPLIHHMLVLRYDVDPWELFGWSMYAVPAARVAVAIDLERGDEVEPLRPLGELFARVRVFARRRSALGALASSESLARELLADDAQLDAVVVTTRSLVLDPQTTLWRLHERSERYVR